MCYPPALGRVIECAQQLKSVFVINKDFPGDRGRFTLAHELGHIIMHQMPFPEMEVEANAFAAEFLMPDEKMMMVLIGLSLRDLAELKLEWKVSMQALLYRASELKVINKRTAQYYWMTMSRAGFRKQEPNPISQEKAKTICYMLRSFIDSCNKSESLMRHKLKLSVNDFIFYYADFFDEGELAIA